ncbi:SCO2322 family protein [Streptacidiphilus albus]|uniref:SCO2322 family protein n=1 Tax=Streptacidiphilus albus TaxID=105425 RepID=UPI0005A9BF2B|nr:SCO2322 family protein [Streptacidiphilus albus]
MTLRHLSRIRRPGHLRRGLTVAVLLSAAALLGIGPAAASSYRYWSFWEGSGSGWTYQQSGPNTFVPADGSVDGWRFGVSADSSAAEKPRSAPDFAAACAHTPAVSGKKRVAVVIDYGTAADSGSNATPPAELTLCATLAEDASSAQLLAQVSPPLRYDSNGILCAITGYPQSGCGEVVSGAAATATATAADGSTAATAPSATATAKKAAPKPTKSNPAALAIGVLFFGLLIGGTLAMNRRRRNR